MNPYWAALAVEIVAVRLLYPRIAVWLRDRKTEREEEADVDAWRDKMDKWRK